MNYRPWSVDPATWGAFGDFIGGILNPFVAGCALYWLTRSIRIQRAELVATKKELAESRLAQQNQASTLERQRFEGTFFSLIDQHNKLLEKLTATNSENNYARSDAEKLITAIFHNGFSLVEAKRSMEQSEREHGHYFRVLYQLLKFIAVKFSNGISEKMTPEEILSVPVQSDEKFYANIVRSFINIDIAQLLAINCYCDQENSFWKYKCLLERYEFLEHMPFERDGIRFYTLEEAFDFYNPPAFGSSDYIEMLMECRQRSRNELEVVGDSESAT